MLRKLVGAEQSRADSCKQFNPPSLEDVTCCDLQTQYMELQ